MALRSLGSQNTDQPKTPTLRQFWKLKDGKVAKSHLVTILFKPNKAPNYSLIVEVGFRVSILEDNPLHKIIADSIAEWTENEVPLYLTITNGEKGQFELSESDHETIEWNEYSWGWKMENLTNKKPVGNKKGTVVPS